MHKVSVARSPRGREAAVALLLIAASCVYLWPFVRRGWIAHDEGVLGLSAVRLLAGQLPHIDFQDYSGGMTWFYAGLFRFLGTDVVWIRYALLCGALAAVMAWYRIARRFAGAWAAAGATLTTLLWSFPNYFAGLPSWWNVIFASFAALCLIRYAERKTHGSLLVAGLWLGLACAFKQLGAYLFGAALLAILYADQSRQQPAARSTGWQVWIRAATCAAAALALAYIFRGRPSLPAIVLLATPIGALGALLVADDLQRADREPRARGRAVARDVAMLFAGGSIPLLLLVTPYLASGRLGGLLYGAFVVPQRLRDFAYYAFPTLWLSLALIPMALVIARAARVNATSPGSGATAWVWTIPLVVSLSLVSDVVYLLTWNAFRSGEALVVVASAWWLWEQRRSARAEAVPLFVLATVTAFISLFQYPFAAPVYYMYVAPFAVLTLFAYLSVQRGAAVLRLPIFIALALFAGLTLNRGYLQDMGYHHKVRVFDTELDLPKASLKVSASDAFQYRRVVELVTAHAQRKTIHAFPDCPEVYFLSGTTNPTPANFDRFWPMTEAATLELWQSHDIRLIVINHEPQFSKRPSDQVMSDARRIFPDGERAGQFEVRWRD